MGRPRRCLEPRRATVVRLPVAVHARRRAEVDAGMVSVNRLAERALTKLVDRLPPADAGLGRRR